MGGAGLRGRGGAHHEPRQREFYDLESFYDEAEEIPLPFAAEASPAA